MRSANMWSAYRDARQQVRSIPGKQRDIRIQYLQFSLIGASNALVDLGILNLLMILHPTHTALGLLADNTIAVSLAIFNSYLWNTRWTFNAEATHTPRQRLLFIAQALLNILINNLVLLGMTSLLPPMQGIAYFIGSNIAKLAAMLVASSTSFLLLRIIVFRPRTV